MNSRFHILVNHYKRDVFTVSIVAGGARHYLDSTCEQVTVMGEPSRERWTVEESEGLFASIELL